MKLLRLHLLVMYYIDLLLVARDSNRGLLLPLFKLILCQPELGDILIPIDFFHVYCRHADVDRDDVLCPIS